MKKTLVLIAILTLTLWSASYAIIGIGVHAGMGNYGTSDKDTIKGASESGLLLGAHVDFNVLPIIGVEVSASYWSKSQTVGTTKTTFSIIPLEGTAMYKFSIPMSPITPYVGAGLGIYMAKAKAESNGLSFETSDSKFGIHGAAGANLKLPTMPLSFGVQGKYAAIFSDPGSHLLSIVGMATYNF